MSWRHSSNNGLPPQPSRSRGSGPGGSRSAQQHQQQQQLQQYNRYNKRQPPGPAHSVPVAGGYGAPSPYYVDGYSGSIDDSPSLKRPRVDKYYSHPQMASPSYSYPPSRYSGYPQQQQPPPPPPVQGAYNNRRSSSGPYDGMSPMYHHGPPPPMNSAPSSSGSRPPRVYSDFRIARVRVGKFEVNEYDLKTQRHDGSRRDSRLRLYFRNSDDYPIPVNSNLSTQDKALAEPDRISITMNQGSKRMIIPVQDGLDKVLFNRKDGYFKIRTYGWALFEEVDEASNNSYNNSKVTHFRKCADFTNGELSSDEKIVEVWLDQKNPLSMEPKWTRGNIQDYVDSRSKFRSLKVLEVVDPEQISNFDGVVGLWSRESTISDRNEREKFVQTKLCKLEYMLELCSKILAPPHYYVSKSAHSNSLTAAQMIETGQIPALISPAVNALIASAAQIASEKASMSEQAIVEYLKLVLYQSPEPIIWRSLDGLFGKRNEPLNFNSSKILEQAKMKAQYPTTEQETQEQQQQHQERESVKRDQEEDQMDIQEDLSEEYGSVNYPEDEDSNANEIDLD